jgi:hypothetical protein
MQWVKLLCERVQLVVLQIGKGELRKKRAIREGQGMVVGGR